MVQLTLLIFFSSLTSIVLSLTRMLESNFMPRIGFGCWKVPREATADVVYDAIKVGYRAFDCACDYGNDVEVGHGLKRAMDEGIVSRSDIFVTNKLWSTYHGHVEAACQKSLEDMQLDFFDLYLIHFPIAIKFVPFEVRYPPSWAHDPAASNPKIELSNVPYSQVWVGMEALKKSGVAKHIGVCNLNVQGLREVCASCEIRPENLQVELHPYLTQNRLVAYVKDTLGIPVTAYSPLGASSYIEIGLADSVGVLDEAVVKDIAAKHGRTAAQVILAWHLSRGVSVIPKSSKLSRIKENFDILNITLEPAEIAAIGALNRNKRFNDPGVFCVGLGGSIPIFD